MPYYIYIITPGVSSTAKTAEFVSEFGSFKEAKKEARRLRGEKPLDDSQAYKIVFAENRPQAMDKLKEFREQTVVKEWEK